jgi:hypothetical protein
MFLRYYTAQSMNSCVFRVKRTGPNRLCIHRHHVHEDRLGCILSNQGLYQVKQRIEAYSLWAGEPIDFVPSPQRGVKGPQVSNMARHGAAVFQGSHQSSIIIWSIWSDREQVGPRLGERFSHANAHHARSALSQPVLDGGSPSERIL